MEPVSKTKWKSLEKWHPSWHLASMYMHTQTLTQTRGGQEGREEKHTQRQRHNYHHLLHIALCFYKNVHIKVHFEICCSESFVKGIESFIRHPSVIENGSITIKFFFSPLCGQSCSSPNRWPPPSVLCFYRFTFSMMPLKVNQGRYRLLMLAFCI